MSSKNLIKNQKSRVALVGDFQEKQCHLLLISQHNSMLNLLCNGAICMNTTKNFVPLHNDSICEINPLPREDIIYFDIVINVALSHRMDKMQNFM